MDQALLRSLQQKLDTCATGIRLTTKKTVDGKEVLELKRVDDPSKTVTCAQAEVRTKLSPEQTKAYRALEDNFLAAKRDGTLPKGAAFQKRDAQKKIINNGDPATNPKVAEVKQLIAAAPGKKFIVFATNQYALDTLTAGLGLPPNKTRQINGGVASKKRVAIAKEMTDNPDIQVLSCTDAANAGLNITGATEVIMFDTSDTPAIVEQRFRRSFRRGQKQDVRVHHLRSDAPVEMAAERGLKRKGKSMTTVERLTIADERGGMAGTLREILDRAEGGAQ
jgi:superfamily II DNA/RNA helicase